MNKEKVYKSALVIFITAVFVYGIVVAIKGLSEVPAFLAIVTIPLLLIYVGALYIIFKLSKTNKQNNVPAYKKGIIRGVIFIFACAALMYPVIYLKLDNIVLLWGLRIAGITIYILASFFLMRAYKKDVENEE